jgi:hypothetical protein
MSSCLAQSFNEEIIFSSKELLAQDLDCLLTNKIIIIENKEKENFNKKITWLNENKPLPEGFKFTQINLEYSHDKKQALEDLAVAIKPLLPSRMVAVALTTADELIMNAFFDAPFENGKVLFKNLPRHENVKSPKPITLTLGTNGQELAISVEDNYGSVNPNAIVKHLKKTFVSEQYFEPSTGTGAGIGLSLCVKRNTSLIIKVSPGYKSQFVAFFPLVSNFKSYLEKSQIISLQIQNSK